jgi:acyl-CoA-binding protein
VDHRDFDEAVALAMKLAPQPPEVMMEVYGLYKQATQGDVQGRRPGIIDFKGQTKYDAWANRRGMSREDAMTAYVELVRRLVTQR